MSAYRYTGALAEWLLQIRRSSKLVLASCIAQYTWDVNYIGWSGFTGVGYQKTMPTAPTRKEISLFVGASVGSEVEDLWAALDMITRRYPHQVGINTGPRIQFADKHRSMFPQDLTYNLYKNIATQLNPWTRSHCYHARRAYRPGASVGAILEIVQSASKIIIKAYTTSINPSSRSTASPTSSPTPRIGIGSTAIPVDPDCVVAILESTKPDNTGLNAPETDSSCAIAKHLIRSLLPLQPGIGNVANSIIGGVADGPFDNVQ
ncbi:hypothetical protein BT96DRAFT_966418, partial [Gymnopus androsaceus JB14]